MGADDRHERLAATLRLVAAAAAVAVFAVDPSEHPGRRGPAHGVLAGFLVYAAVTWALAARRDRSVRTSVLPWIDVAWVTLAVAVSQATSGIFSPLYLFAILSASFWGGVRQGVATAVVSALAFAFVGGATAPAGIDLRLFLVRPTYLLVLGILVAVWVGREVRSRARLALLRDVTALSTQERALDPMIGRFLEAVRAYFDADSARLVVADGRTGPWTRVAVKGRPPDARPTAVPAELARALLPEPPGAVLVARSATGYVEVLPEGAGAPGATDPAVGAALLAALDARTLLSVPFRYHASAPARLHVERRAPVDFDAGDAAFLRQVVDQALPVFENLRLVDRLVEDAAKDERRRIALDLHDSVIQPYLGLRLGLSAARTALGAGRVDEGTALVARLVEMADAELEALRGYARELRVDCGGPEPAIRRFCRRFSDATGIHVEVAPLPALDERLGPEVVQLVAEALSNVRRHTRATRAAVRFAAEEGRVQVTVENDGTPPDPAPFLPRSLAERAASLGGRLQVEHPSAGTTAVKVELPVAAGGTPA